MFHSGKKREAMGDDPPYLAVGTEVSAKYKGAFCEAKVRKVVRSVKCRVTFKLGLGTSTVTDDQIKGTLRAGANVEVKHPEKKEFVEATITKIQDCSQYTVVFDDGDITTLRRTALCLKSGRHFAESETLDQLPLTHPEHFSNPVIGGRRGRRSRQAQDDSSDEEETPKKGKKKDEKEADIGKVVCVELGDKKKQKDNWFPGLVVAPTAQDTVRIRVKDDYLVRSFKDGRYYTVPKKEATEFTREIGSKVDNNTLKTAVEKALQFLDKDELPPHWDRELLFSIGESSESGSDAGSDSESSDDERQEEKDHFVAQLYKFMDDCGTPINKGPTIFDEDLDLYKLFKVVHKLGGYNRVTNQNQWKLVAGKLNLKSLTTVTANHVKQSYKKYLHSFEDFYRKLGCTMVNHPRGSRARHRSGRSLIRDRDRATPVNTPKLAPEKDKEKPSTSTSSSTTPVPMKKQEVEEEKKKPATKVKEEKPKPKEEKKEVKEPVEETPKPRRELKMRSERLKLKEEVAKKQTWQDDSQSEEEAGSSVSGSHAKSDAGSNTPSTETPDVERIEPKWASQKVEQEEEESREVTEKPGSEKKEEQRERRRPFSERKAEASRAQKEEEEEKTLRSRSKGGVTPERKTRESRTPIRDSEKKIMSVRSRTRDDEPPHPPPHPPPHLPPHPPPHPPPHVFTHSSPNPPHPPNPLQMPKKRGRKRKDSDKSHGEVPGHVANDVLVVLGDKLKVYYGPTIESKVTYEAKVIEIEEDGSPNMFLVHYTGWNTRYDEWIPRQRIAENLSWTPARAKRSRLQQQQQQQQQAQQAQQQSSQTPKSMRGRPTGRSEGGSAASSQHTRSTTPSSVTSSSSRTKSPAQSSRAQRAASRSEQATVSGSNVSSIELRRRPRRISGHADFLNNSESDSESDFEEMEVSIPINLRRRRDRQDSESSVKAEVPEPRRLERFAKRRSLKKEKSEEEEEEEETEEKEGDSDSQGPPRRSSRRIRRITESERKEEEPQPTVSTKTSGAEEQPKGRDFDLNQIRSELKGFDKAVKSPTESVPCESDDKVISSTVKSEPEEPSTPEVVAEKSEEPPATPSSSKKDASDPARADTEDIYEFKEPEPFEFEVRGKRDTSLSDKLSKRPVVRLFEDTPEPKKETPKKKTPKKDVKPTPPKNDEVSSPDTEVKKRRRGPVKKLEDEIIEKRSKSKSPSPTKTQTTQQQQQQKSDALTASEEAFKKLYASTTFPVLDTQSTTSTTQSSALKSPRALDLFSDLPENPDEDHGDDEGEDRLVISETDAEPPLFSYPQRHEEMLPTPSSRAPCPTSPEPGKSSDQSKTDLMSLFSFGTSKDSEVVKLVVQKAEDEEGTSAQVVERPVQINDDVMKLLLKEDDDDDDDDDEEDSINAAIQRVISQSMNDEEDVDFFGKSATPTKATPTKATPKVTPKTTPKATPLSTESKTTPKPAQSSENVSKATPKATQPPPKLQPIETYSKATPKVLHPVETYSKSTPKVTPAPNIECISKSTPKLVQPVETPKTTPKVIQSPEAVSKAIPKPSPLTETTSKSTVKPSPVSSDTPKVAIKPIESISKTLVKIIQPVETITKPSPKVVPVAESTTKSNIKTIPALETISKTSLKIVQPPEIFKLGVKTSATVETITKPVAKTTPVVEPVNKTATSIAKASTGFVKTTPPITKLTPVIPEVPASKISNKPSPSTPAETSGKSSPKTVINVEPVSKIINKSTPSATEIISKTKSISPVETPPNKIKAPTPVEPPSKATYVKPSTSAETTSKATPKPIPQPPILKESLKREAKKEPRKKALKKTVSKEFVEDSSTDSDSSEELKLVIDKLDEESVPDSSDLDIDLKKEEAKKDTPVSTRTPAKKTEQEPTPKPEVTKSEAEGKRLSESEPEKKRRKEEEPVIKSVPVAETSKRAKTEVCKKEEEEADSSLNSLLCEETIPGSPVPPAEAPPPVCEEPPKVREIPFASMPAGSNGASTSGTAQSPQKAFASRSQDDSNQPAVEVPARPIGAVPAPAAAAKKEENEAAPVMDNTPPTTPESSISTISGSPREDRVGASPHRDENKSQRDSSEVDLDSPAEATKPDAYSEDSLLNVEVSSSCDTSKPKAGTKRGTDTDKDLLESPSKKRRRPCKKEDIPIQKRMRHSSGRSNRNVGNNSDSDENSENSNHVNTSSISSTDHLLANRSPRPSKYNFYVELDPELDGSQRIALVQNKMTELRKTYMAVKAELACIDRRRKKLRRRGREASKAAAAAAKQEVWCS